MTSALQWAIWAVVMTVVMGLLARTWKKQRAAYTGEDLRYGKLIAVVGLSTGLPFLGGAVAAAIFAPMSDKWVVAVFLGFACLGGWLLYEYLRVRIRLQSDGFSYRTALGQGEAQWREVRRIDYAASMSWFVLTLDGDRTVRLSVLLLGLDRFAKALLEQSGAADMNPFTRGVLTRTANGNPPSPWG